jgi:16S rRNA A1518/A1519 N6-dimethyltransferase RsmA/KsgA/DIM1 with predicted DNA glycosylase/AP lyase activity
MDGINLVVERFGAELDKEIGFLSILMDFYGDASPTIDVAPDIHFPLTQFKGGSL